MLAIIDSNKFNYKNKIGEFKYIDIKDLVNNIRNNTISEISAKKSLNTLNEIKNAEIIKHKKYTFKQKKLLNLFNDLLDTILTNKTLMSPKDEKENENGNDQILTSSKDENENENQNKNEIENENDKTLMSSKDDDEKENDNDNENENEDHESRRKPYKNKKHK